MPSEDLESLIIKRGVQLFSSIQDQKPSLFSKAQWADKFIKWSMQDESFKTRLFRFIDVFPSLKSSKSLARHIREYFIEGFTAPPFMKWGLSIASHGGFLGVEILSWLISTNIKTMAKQLIIGENTNQAIKALEQLRKKGFAFTVDILGETTITEEEAQKYQTTYCELFQVIDKTQHRWKALSVHGLSFDFNKDWGYSPFSQFSIKISALYSQIKPVDFENSVQSVLDRLKKIYRRVIQIGGSLCIDMEHYQYKAMTLEIFRRLRSDPEFRNYPHLGIALQAYLRDTPKDLADLIQWAKANGLPIEIRLVKGAYWDSEVIFARQNNWEPCVLIEKNETDAAFEQLARTILENHEICYLACASHNLRSISAVIEMAKELKVPDIAYEFQLLYGMALSVQNVLRDHVGRVRLYCPYGEMIPGMGYLVRRLLENTANDSFLRQSSVENIDIETLLRNPKNNLRLNIKVKKSENENKSLLE